MLRDSAFVFTRPIYFRIVFGFVPAAAMVVGDVISCGMVRFFFWLRSSHFNMSELPGSSVFQGFSISEAKSALAWSVRPYYSIDTLARGERRKPEH